MKEWYLIGNASPSMIGGFEDVYYADSREMAFIESLNTDIADSVILYNYDLSNSKEIRCIIQGNVADTQLKSMERSILVPIGTLHSGDYIYFEDEYWIVDGRVGNNKIYEKATLKECQYKLRWQKNDGTIIERWANFVSASKYDVGEVVGKNIILTSNNFSIIIPNDKDSMTIDGKRVFIDLSENPEKVFKITRNDDVLFSHGKHGGTLNLIADKMELNENTDRKDLRLCDYIEVLDNSDTSTFIFDHKNKVDNLTANILYKGSNELKIGGSSKTLSGSFKNTDEVELSDVGTWEIITIDELLPYINYSINKNTLKINILENNLYDSKVRIKFSNANNTVSTYIDFDVVSMI